MKKQTFLLFLASLLCCWTAEATTYYVATAAGGGSDSNNGTSTATPCLTVDHVFTLWTSGDTIYVRSGTYFQPIYEYGVTGGTSGHTNLIATYPGDATAIFDGTGQTASPLIELAEGYTTLSNIIQQNNRTTNYEIGIEIFGTNDLVTGCIARSNYAQGILIYGYALYSVVSNCINHDNDLGDYQYTNSNWGSGLSIAKGAISNTITHCTTYHNWGEGLSAFNTTNSTLSYNVSFDNKLECYLSDSINSAVIGNLLYTTPGNAWSNTTQQIGIYLGDETFTPPSANNTVINNIAWGNTMNFACNGMTNNVIANNTFANATDTTHGNVTIGLGSGLWVNDLIINNLTIQDNSAVPITDGPSTTSGITWATNQWSSSPTQTYFTGNGGSVAGASLREVGSQVPGFFSPDWAIPFTNSPAIKTGNASTNNLGVDYYGNSRTTPPNVGAVDGPGVSLPVTVVITP